LRNQQNGADLIVEEGWIGEQAVEEVGVKVGGLVLGREIITKGRGWGGPWEEKEEEKEK